MEVGQGAADNCRYSAGNHFDGARGDKSNIWVKLGLNDSVVSLRGSDLLHLEHELIDVGLLDWVDSLDDVPEDVLVAWGHGSRALVHPSVIEVDGVHHLTESNCVDNRIVNAELEILEEVVEHLSVIVRDLIVVVN